jgi:hypothetical protein
MNYAPNTHLRELLKLYESQDKREPNKGMYYAASARLCELQGDAYEAHALAEEAQPWHEETERRAGIAHWRDMAASYRRMAREHWNLARMAQAAQAEQPAIAIYEGRCGSVAS